MNPSTPYPAFPIRWLRDTLADSTPTHRKIQPPRARGRRWPDTIVFDCDDTLVDLRRVLATRSADPAGVGDSLITDRPNVWMHWVVRAGILEQARLEPGAVEAVAALQDAGYAIEVWCGRAYHPDARRVTARTLAPLGLPASAIHILGFYESKLAALRARPDVRLLVDDWLPGMPDQSDDARLVLVARDWNQDSTLPRFTDLRDIAHYAAALRQHPVAG